MRIARLVGLSPDGKHLIMATDTGEQIAIVADSRLRAALRGDRPRLGQLEIEMESALRPRDIQTRIRSGESVEDVARVAGVPVERIEPYAAPVLAEREHVASLAVTSSVRRRGETSGHRRLRQAVAERLAARGVDVDAVEWDSARMEDGRWAVSASYRSGEAQHRAVFHFDVPGRFSVAANDEARWVLGEPTSVRGPQPGRRAAVPGEGRDGGAPTLDLANDLRKPPDDLTDDLTDDPSDEMAIVRAVQDEPATGADVITLRPAEPAEDLRPRAAADDARSDDAPADDTSGDDTSGDDAPSGDAATPAGRSVAAGATPDATEDTGPLSVEGVNPDSQLDALARMMDASSGETTVHGPSEAAAVPVSNLGGWEPAIVVDYPLGADTLEPEVDPDSGVRHDRAEEEEELEHELHPNTAPAPTPPSTEERTEERTRESTEESTRENRPEPEQPGDGVPDRPEPTRAPGTATPLPVKPAQPTPGQPAPGADDPDAEAPDSPLPAPGFDDPILQAAEEDASPVEPPADESTESRAATEPPARAARRKRAAVPSWDEIMFGGPSAKR